jgi:hypothetical protein
MKKKIIIALSALLVFGLVAVVYAYNRAENTQEMAAHSCPMKKSGAETASADKKDSCCGMADCCKDGQCKMNGACCKDHDNCPMKDVQKTENRQTVDYSKITVSDDSGEDCCAGGGSACCAGGGGACCKGKHG